MATYGSRATVRARLMACVRSRWWRAQLPEMRRETILDHTFAILRNAYTIAGARQLFHNRSEITLYLLPKERTRAPD